MSSACTIRCAYIKSFDIARGCLIEIRVILNRLKAGIILKEITGEEIKRLIKEGYIRHNGKNFIDSNGFIVSYHRTRNKRYIEDKYADLVERVSSIRH